MRLSTPVAAALALSLAPLAAPAHAGPAVTVYTQDLAFVRETRALELRAARDTVRLDDVPERLDFSSARLAPADATARVTRLAWRWDVASGEGLIGAAIGRRVAVTSRGDRVTEGTLVAADGAWLVVRAADGTLHDVARAAVETLRLPDPPAGLRVRPALEAVVEGARRGRVEAELSYLTGGLSWSAEHLVVRRGESAATWSSAVLVENATGRAFEDATLKLVAGEPRRTGGAPSPMPRGVMSMELAGAAADAKLAEEAFAEYHLYTLSRPATLRHGERQSLVLHEPRDVKAAPRYLYRGGDPRGVAAELVIVNDRAAGLGVPVPAGRVRIYEADASGALQFTGEARVGHVAEGETLTLEVGSVFDLVAERRELSNRRIADREREVSVEVRLRNRKKGAVVIVLEEPVSGDTEVLRASHPLARKDAHTLRAEVAVPAGGETVVTYTARIRF
uniref:DUF4139 domain-containing protein n=1 Tax=Eiseniibacteriota bacterium TaxID=2212470 RepID=A0A832MIQ9_UNCEI